MRGTPIIIEPKHIRGNPQTNIVNNNWIDCVTVIEKDMGLQKEEIFNSIFSFYEAPLKATYLTTPISDYKDITDRNAYTPYKTLSRNSYPGLSEKYYYYKVSTKRKYRTIRGFPSLQLEITHNRMSNILGSSVNTASYEARETKELFTRGSVARFNYYDSADEFENAFVDGNTMKSDSSFAIGVVFKEGEIEFLIILRALRFEDRASSPGPTLSCTVKIYLDLLYSNDKSIRYYLNPTTGACEIAPDTFKAKYPYTHPTNELMQSDSTALNKYNNNRREKLSKVIANSILYQWKRGKQTAKVEVLIGLDYFDQNGNRLIGKDLERKMFKPCDWVIPYSVEQDGGTLKKVPLAKNRLGLPKVFEITSAEFRYDGEMKQYLKMVEVIE